MNCVSKLWFKPQSSLGLTIATLFWSIFQTSLHPYTTILHSAARLAKGLKPRYHITPALRQLNWLPIKARKTYKICRLMFNINSGSSPRYMSSMVPPCNQIQSRTNFWSSTKGDYVIQRTTRTLFRGAFSDAGPSERNKLPIVVREAPSTSFFKSGLKTHLFKIHYDWKTSDWSNIIKRLWVRLDFSWALWKDSCIVLYCIVLYCIVLYCIVLYCIVLYCIVLYCIVLYCIVLYCIVLYCIVLYCIVLYCIVLYCIALYCIAVHCIALHCIAFYCIVSYRIVSYRIVSYRIVSYRIVSYRIVSYCISSIGQRSITRVSFSFHAGGWLRPESRIQWRTKGHWAMTPFGKQVYFRHRTN